MVSRAHCLPFGLRQGVFIVNQGTISSHEALSIALGRQVDAMALRHNSNANTGTHEGRRDLANFW